MSNNRQLFEKISASENPTKSSWYDTDKTTLYWFNEEKVWSCRHDRISEEFPTCWYRSVSVPKEIDDKEIKKLATSFIVKKSWNVMPGTGQTEQEMTAFGEAYARMKQCYIEGFNEALRSRMLPMLKQVVSHQDIWFQINKWRYDSEGNVSNWSASNQQKLFEWITSALNENPVLPIVGENKWVSVEERLPEMFEGWSKERVLAFDGHIIKVVSLYPTGHTGILGYNTRATDYMNGITHWQPLPTPPVFTEFYKQGK